MLAAHAFAAMGLWEGTQEVPASAETRLLFRNCGCTAQESSAAVAQCGHMCLLFLLRTFIYTHTYITSLDLIFIFVNFGMVPKHCLCQLYKQLLSGTCLTLPRAPFGSQLCLGEGWSLSRVIGTRVLPAAGFALHNCLCSCSRSTSRECLFQAVFPVLRR